LSPALPARLIVGDVVEYVAAVVGVAIATVGRVVSPGAVVIVHVNGHWAHKKDEDRLQLPAAFQALQGYIAVTIDSHQGPSAKPADQTIRYDLVREAGGWKIDEIKGAVDGKAWSLRAMLTDFLKY